MERQLVLRAAITSRLTLIFLQYVSNLLIPDHDPDVFKYPKPENTTFFDQQVYHFFGGFLRWDAQYFVHISRHGYNYENTLAFFPLAPFLVRLLASILQLFLPLSLDTLILLVFVVINNLFFLLSALALYDLSVETVGKKLAFKSAILFTYNPASVFFSAPYTECVFSYLSFKAMLNCVLLYRKHLKGDLKVKNIRYVIPICLSTVTRSNGVLNIGFLLYFMICLYFKKSKQNLRVALNFILLGLILSLICVLPFIIFQIYSYQMFCKDFQTDFHENIVNYAKDNKFILPGTFSLHNQSWCHTALPLAYSYIQKHYWNVGFLKYYELKQIPNFILAFPVVYIVISEASVFLKNYLSDPWKIFNFDLHLNKVKLGNKYPPVICVFAIHAFFLTVFCVFNVHVQVTTRMLCSSSPVVYWFASSYIGDLREESNLFKYSFGGSHRWKENLILSYFLGYFVIGTVLFCNNLPWT